MSTIPVMGNHVVHSNVTDHHDFMTKLHAFCVTAGWSIQTWKQGEDWIHQGGGVYGFSPGVEDFLEIRSTGHGTQAMQFRFRLQDIGTNNNRYLNVGAFAGAVGYDTTNSTHPVLRDDGGNPNWNTDENIGISSDPMPEVWFFGDENRIIVVIKYDDTYIQYFAVGSLQLHDPAETEGYMCLMPTTSQLWYQKNAGPSWDGIGNDYRFYIDGAGLYTYPNFYGGTGKTSVNMYRGISMFNITRLANTYSSRRPLSQQHLFKQLPSPDDRWIEIGKYPFARMQHDGLLIGEKVFYDGEEYVTFPWNVVDVNTIGFAIRVN